jgi:hypothetical protein
MSLALDFTPHHGPPSQCCDFWHHPHDAACTVPCDDKAAICAGTSDACLRVSLRVAGEGTEWKGGQGGFKHGHHFPAERDLLLENLHVELL